MTATRLRNPLLDLLPAEVAARWPQYLPLAALLSYGPRARFSLLGVPSQPASFFAPPTPLAPPNPHTTAHPTSPQRPTPGWFGILPYELGQVFEPRAALHPPAAPAAPTWLRIESGLLFDHITARWSILGGGRDLIRLLEDAPRPFHLAHPESATGEAAYTAAVRRAVEYIRAGDVYQVNLSHPLRARFSGSARALFAHLADRARPWYGAYAELDSGPERTAVLSLSPESFLEIDRGRIESRPMKGTRPAGADADELRLSPKDRAELNMIIDLMRNDIGRLCELGSIRVDAPREIELHGSPTDGILQATAAVSGTLRPGLTLADVLRATFPPGSITGAPKVRAMQIIEELEARPRDYYCGAIGFLADDGRAAFNVAIRTATLRAPQPPAGAPRDAFTNAAFDFPVGAGIVADSIPELEWRETLDKAWLLHAIAE